VESRFRLQTIGEKRYLLDVRGQVCPYPELLTLRAVNSLSLGDTLEVITDNPPSVRDVPLTLKERGYTIDEPTSLKRGGWKLTVRL
jgi:tRNA 2-thiouridine synthesizing protein A